jgi:hypothetical protein
MGVLGSGLRTSTISTPLPLNFKECIQISNGITKFIKSNEYSFVNNCIVNVNFKKVIIQVTPNPFSNFINVKTISKIDEKEELKIVIVNSYGLIMKIYKIHPSSLINGVQLPLSDLTTGLYYLQLYSSKIYEIINIQKL